MDGLEQGRIGRAKRLVSFVVRTPWYGRDHVQFVGWVESSRPTFSTPIRDERLSAISLPVAERQGDHQ